MMRAAVKDRQTHQPLILFDGVCNLCSTCVKFVIQRERQATFRFASLQSEIGCTVSRVANAADLGSIVLIQNGRQYEKSAAVLRVALKLNRLWPMLFCFIFIPAFAILFMTTLAIDATAGLAKPKTAGYPLMH